MRSELIARYNENPNSQSPFSVNSILNISEIGLIVVGEQFNKINIFDSDNDPDTNSSLNFMQENNNVVIIRLTSIDRRWLFSEKKSKVVPYIVLKITFHNFSCILSE